MIRGDEPGDYRVSQCPGGCSPVVTCSGDEPRGEYSVKFLRMCVPTCTWGMNRLVFRAGADIRGVPPPPCTWG